MHSYTLLQIFITIGIFAITFTIAAPVFPVIFIILVPIRLKVMKRIWNRDALRYVDAWACKEGTPEDEEDARMLQAARAEDAKGKSGEV